MSEEASQPEPQPRVGQEAQQPTAAPDDPSATEKTATEHDPPPPAEAETEAEDAVAGDADAAEGVKDGSGSGGGGDTTNDATMEGAAGEDGGAGPSSSAEAPATGDGDKDAGENKEVEAAGGSGGGGGGGDDDPPKITTRPGPALPPPLDDIQMVNVSGDGGGGVGVKVEKTRHLVEINCEGFTPEQLARLPVAFAYRLGDGGESERAAMIAQDEWYRQRRLEKEEEMARKSRAAAAGASTTGTTQKKSKPAPHKKTGEKKPAKPDATGRVRPYEIESIPAPGLPEGWIRKSFNRKTGDHVDKYWFTPKTSKRLRSKTEVNKFIQYLEQTGGDEDDAFDMLKNKPVGTTRRLSK